MAENDKELLEPDAIDKNLSVVEEQQLIEGKALVSMYDNIETMLKDDRDQTDHILTNFVAMLIDEGDATTSTKEAICKLIELKMKAADNITRIADLKTRIVLKEKNTFPAYLAQHNTYNINGEEEKIDKRKLLKDIEKKKKDANDAKEKT